MKQKTLISVVVPIYNVEDYLNRCVTSLVNQTYKNLEIILVDDGSPDSCPKICDEWAHKDSRIIVVHKVNGGLSDARNAGFNVASGELIAFIDSDDWIDIDAFEKMYNRLLEDDSDVVSCGVKWVSEDGSLINEVSVKDEEVFDTHSAMSEIIVDGKLKQHVWNKLYKRKLIEDIPFEKGKYHEDVFWSYQVFGRAQKVSLMKESFYNYVQRSNSIMGESYSVKRLDALDAMKQRCEFVRVNFPDLYDKALYIYMASCMYHLQLAVHSKQNKDVIRNIIERVGYRKTGDPTVGLNIKSKMWLRLFFCCPLFTSRVRNLLKVGL